MSLMSSAVVLLLGSSFHLTFRICIITKMYACKCGQRPAYSCNVCVIWYMLLLSNDFYAFP